MPAPRRLSERPVTHAATRSPDRSPSLPAPESNKPPPPPPGTPPRHPQTSTPPSDSSQQQRRQQSGHRERPAIPTTVPVNASINPCRTTIISTDCRDAPSAIRIPNSFVRCVTESAITAAIPLALIINASNAKSPSKIVVTRGDATDSCCSRSSVATRSTANCESTSCSVARTAEIIAAGSPAVLTTRFDAEAVLRDGGVKFVLHLAVQPVLLHISNHSHNRGPMLPLVERHTLSHRVFRRPPDAEPSSD